MSGVDKEEFFLQVRKIGVGECASSCLGLISRVDLTIEDGLWTRVNERRGSVKRKVGRGSRECEGFVSDSCDSD